MKKPFAFRKGMMLIQTDLKLFMEYKYLQYTQISVFSNKTFRNILDIIQN